MGDDKKRILVVDDIPDVLETLSAILQPEYRVIVATNGQKALDLANSPTQPDLILLDIIMPTMNGYEVCQALKTNPATRNIPVIFVTAKDEEIDEVKGFECGAADYLVKPVSPPIVRARVNAHLTIATFMKELAKQNALMAENIRLREDVERMAQHDLKGPLTAIINIPKMLARDKSLTSNQVELIEVIGKSAHRMLEMINRSSDLYKMEKGLYTLVPVPVNLVQVARNVFQQLEALVQFKRIDYSLCIKDHPAREDDVFEVQGEDFLFFSMFSNLIKNAIEASPDGGKVQVVLDENPNIVLSISNQGLIPQTVREKLFERYATYGKNGGTGLGVYSARLMARTLGGDLSLDGQGEGCTIFRITLPPRPSLTTAPALPAAPGAAAARRPKDKVKILVADDYPFMRRIIMDILRSDGYVHFFEAEDGDTAIEMIEKHQVDLILADWIMPKKSGLDILKFIQQRENLKEIPFIMITANVSLPEFEKAAGAGLQNYITKPFSSDILRKKVSDVLFTRGGNPEPS